MSSESPFRVEIQSGVVLLEPCEKYLTGEMWVRQIRRAIDEIVDKMDSPRIVLDLGQVEHLSSAVLGELISAVRKVSRRHGTIRLAQVCGEVAEVFAITRLDRSFEIHADVASAMKGLKSKSA